MKRFRPCTKQPFKTKLRIGDTVLVISGKDKGKSGKILSFYPKKHKVLVENVNTCKKHHKPTPTQDGGIFSVPRPLHISNVMFQDEATGKGTRLGYQTNESGSKLRFMKANQKSL